MSEFANHVWIPERSDHDGAGGRKRVEPRGDLRREGEPSFAFDAAHVRADHHAFAWLQERIEHGPWRARRHPHFPRAGQRLPQFSGEGVPGFDVEFARVRHDHGGRIAMQRYQRALVAKQRHRLL